MFKINENYLKLPGSYLFSTIAKKVSAYSAANPDKEIIRLGIGDVTLPLAPVVIDSLHNAVDEMGKAETFHGYAPDLGYEFLRNAIVEHDYKKRGADISADEIFVSDGAKSDSGNIGDIFSVDNKIAVCDPVYPVYVDTNAMAGRTGDYIPEQQKWSNVIYMPCTAETNFAPELPKETPDIIYLCFPNNPTGSTITKDELQRWVDYANKVGAVIIYDAAYEAYISEENVPHTIYECEGARTCAIELRSFSKNAGFTGTRLGFTVIPKDLKSGDVMLHSLWARRHGTKFNGAPYIIQRAGEAVYTEEGQKQTGEQIAYYMNNAKTILEGLKSAGYTVSGGVNAPYIWLKTPDKMTSWEFFDYLLENANVVGTPGSGFGPRGGKIVKIKIINPNTTQSMTESIENLARRVARSDTQVWAVTPASGPDSIECYVDEYLAVPGVLKEVIRGDREEGADAFIIACFGDPGLQAAREVTSKPVLGICESAIATAKFIAPYFSIVSVLDRSRKVTEDVVSNYGAEKFCRSIRSTGLSVLEFGRDPKKGLEALAYQGKLAVQQDGAECILLGCAGFVDFVEDLSAQLGVPVLDGVMPAVKFAEAMVDMGLRTSKVSTWGFPEQKNIVGFPMFTKQELIF